MLIHTLVHCNDAYIPVPMYTWACHFLRVCKQRADLDTISQNSRQFLITPLIPLHVVIRAASPCSSPSSPCLPFFHLVLPSSCLLYTSDAADEEDSVDLGGRRIIKKTFLRVLPTRWRQKPAGIDTERNNVTVILCIPPLMSETTIHIPA